MIITAIVGCGLVIWGWHTDDENPTGLKMVVTGGIFLLFAAIGRAVEVLEK